MALSVGVDIKSNGPLEHRFETSHTGGGMALASGEVPIASDPGQEQDVGLLLLP